MLEPAKLVLTALKRILRPLVKLLLSHQITYADCARILKECYVEVAEKEFVLEGKPQTDSRLSLLTGIHRKEVKNLRKIIDDQEPMQGAIADFRKLQRVLPSLLDRITYYLYAQRLSLVGAYVVTL